MKRIKEACICQTLHFMLKEDFRHDYAVKVVKEEVALLLPIFIGLDGVLYSMPMADILTFAVALFLIVRTYKEIGAKSAKQSMNIGLQAETR